MRAKVKIYFDFSDWWIGYYRGSNYHFICPLPTVVIRWPRKIQPNADVNSNSLSFYGMNVITSEDVPDNKIWFVNKHGIDENPSKAMVDEILEKVRHMRMTADTAIIRRMTITDRLPTEKPDDLS